MDAVTAGVTAAGGFTANGLAAGIKPSGHFDLALVAAEETVPAVAVFTTSRTAAAPVIVSRRRAAAGRARAVLLNSGSPNAGTGAAGVTATLATTAAVAVRLGCHEDEVLACSTGPIGVPLPVDAVTAATDDLVGGMGADAYHALLAARAIMTTDSTPKTAAAEGSGFTVGGMAKGAGMLRPDMATMLAVLTTDAVADQAVLAPLLAAAADLTFNSLNVDGCQSTNDTVILMASGASRHRPDLDELRACVETVCADLALQMARDAEGASRVVHLEVGGATSPEAARRFGRAVADSALVRSSFYGGDPNWGRVYAALGVAGLPIDPEAVEIAYAGVTVCRGGAPLPFDEPSVAALLTGDFTIDIVVGRGHGRATVVTTDLTPDYVRFNGARS